ncbi:MULTISPECIES: hypothetical protein [unclassified Brenneria]|uniref:hypothetical protein n=1 Tax=unclassified Brenneria TaxID=2634434 RepID=UPI0029C439A7|nr:MULTISPECIES: hypothetical protein [unclassified Brenneria]MDX5630251.1 hypothetical protein [Brenneria sp. L3-3Z]MDX5697396.1 hypothetical protein [Brenneria sp. L4-2C]MEE3660921.1 hypothetical protein [Brenneria sp. g21c3]
MNTRLKNPKANLLPLTDKESIPSSLSRRKFILYGGCVAGTMALAGAPKVMAGNGVNKPKPANCPPGVIGTSCVATDKTLAPGANPAAPATFTIKPATGENIVSEYPFNGSMLYGAMVSSLHEFDTSSLFAHQDNADIILTNLGPQPVFVSASAEINNDLQNDTPLRRLIPSLQSVIIRAGAVITSADAAANGLISLIQVRSTRNVETDVFSQETNWAKYAFPAGMPALPLWISNQLHLAHQIQVNPWHLVGLPAPAGSKALPYELYANLWWLPAGADAGIHAAHGSNFLEVHTQLIGFGRMQKFTNMAKARAAIAGKRVIQPEGGMFSPFDTGKAFPEMYEEFRLAPGNSHLPMPLVKDYDGWKGESDICKNASMDDPCFHYPPHQYYADTDSVWIAFEFHRSADKS